MQVIQKYKIVAFHGVVGEVPAIDMLRDVYCGDSFTSLRLAEKNFKLYKDTGAEEIFFVNIITGQIVKHWQREPRKAWLDEIAASVGGGAK